ncbi:MAG: MAPEG family protein [Pseudomonadota bacterium]
MTLATAYFCILIAALLPYLWTVIAKTRGKRYDNRDPRGWIARQDDPRVQRAYAAHLNAFEAFAPFAAAVLMAQQAGIAPARIALLAIVFVVFRLLHGVLYLAGRAALRSLAWLGGFVCVVVLMAQAILAVAA